MWMASWARHWASSQALQGDMDAKHLPGGRSLVYEAREAGEGRLPKETRSQDAATDTQASHPSVCAWGPEPCPWLSPGTINLPRVKARVLQQDAQRECTLCVPTRLTGGKWRGEAFHAALP